MNNVNHVVRKWRTVANGEKGRKYTGREKAGEREFFIVNYGIVLKTVPLIIRRNAIDSFH